MTVNRILLGMFLTLSFVTAAHAGTWYLMAPDHKVMSEPEAALKMSRGSIVGPIHVTSTAEFSSQQKCEAARPRLIDDWRRRSVMTRSSWTRHGFNNPSDFILCVFAGDPRSRHIISPAFIMLGRWISGYPPGEPANRASIALAAEARFSNTTKLVKADQARGEDRFGTRREAIRPEENSPVEKGCLATPGIVRSAAFNDQLRAVTRGNAGRVLDVDSEFSGGKPVDTPDVVAEDVATLGFWHLFHHLLQLLDVVAGVVGMRKVRSPHEAVAPAKVDHRGQ
jgi:hypothetical protein